jgi:group I intron endonuclease
VTPQSEDTIHRPYGYIYLIRNTVNGKVYVGQTTTSIADRWSQHVSHSRTNGLGKRYPLYNAIRKYGHEAFAVTALTTAADRTILDLKERILIRAYRAMHGGSGYNCRSGGYAGGRHSEETKAKLSAALTGKVRTPEQRQRVGDFFRGKKLPEEHRAKMSATRTGKKMPPRTPEHAVKLGNAHRGRKQSEEEIARRAASLRGKKRTPETIEKMRQSALNRSTAEYRQKCRQSALKRVERNGGVAVVRRRWTKPVQLGLFTDLAS